MNGTVRSTVAALISTLRVALHGIADRRADELAQRRTKENGKANRR